MIRLSLLTNVTTACGPATKPKSPNCDQQSSRDRQERVVGERDSDVRHVIIAEVLERAPHNRHVITLRKVGQARLGDPLLR
jgi:hypothetical protein